MGNRIFVGLVVILWAVTMSWLVVEKILPPFYSGEPPTLGVIEQDEPVCWQIEYDGRAVGIAVRQAVPGAQSTTEIFSRVRLENIPLREMAPQWMSSVVEDLGVICLDVRTGMVLDSLNNLSSFDTRVQLNELPLVVKILGRVDGPKLLLRFISGEVSHEASYPLPSTSMLGGELIPEPKLLQIYVGRRWQTEMFSPFRPPMDSLELLQASVVAEESIICNGRSTRTKRIEYRTMSAAGVDSEHTLRSAAWVADDGSVLRHDLYLMNTRLRFVRRSDPDMIRLAKELLDLDTVATLATPNFAP